MSFIQFEQAVTYQKTTLKLFEGEYFQPTNRAIIMRLNSDSPLVNVIFDINSAHTAQLLNHLDEDPVRKQFLVAMSEAEVFPDFISKIVGVNPRQVLSRYPGKAEKEGVVAKTEDSKTVSVFSINASIRTFKNLCASSTGFDYDAQLHSIMMKFQRSYLNKYDNGIVVYNGTATNCHSLIDTEIYLGEKFWDTVELFILYILEYHGKLLNVDRREPDSYYKTASGVLTTEREKAGNIFMSTNMISERLAIEEKISLFSTGSNFDLLTPGRTWGEFFTTTKNYFHGLFSYNVDRMNTNYSKIADVIVLYWLYPSKLPAVYMGNEYANILNNYSLFGWALSNCTRFVFEQDHIDQLSIVDHSIQLSSSIINTFLKNLINYQVLRMSELKNYFYVNRYYDIVAGVINHKFALPNTGASQIAAYNIIGQIGKNTSFLSYSPGISKELGNMLIDDVEGQPNEYVTSHDWSTNFMSLKIHHKMVLNRAIFGNARKARVVHSGDAKTLLTNVATSGAISDPYYRRTTDKASKGVHYDGFSDDNYLVYIEKLIGNGLYEELYKLSSARFTRINEYIATNFKDATQPSLPGDIKAGWIASIKPYKDKTGIPKDVKDFVSVWLKESFEKMLKDKTVNAQLELIKAFKNNILIALSNIDSLFKTYIHELSTGKKAGGDITVTFSTVGKFTQAMLNGCSFEDLYSDELLLKVAHSKFMTLVNRVIRFYQQFITLDEQVKKDEIEYGKLGLGIKTIDTFYFNLVSKRDPNFRNNKVLDGYERYVQDLILDYDVSESDIYGSDYEAHFLLSDTGGWNTSNVKEMSMINNKYSIFENIITDMLIRMKSLTAIENKRSNFNLFISTDDDYQDGLAPVLSKKNFVRSKKGYTLFDNVRNIGTTLASINATQIFPNIAISYRNSAGVVTTQIIPIPAWQEHLIIQFSDNVLILRSISQLEAIIDEQLVAISHIGNTPGGINVNVLTEYAMKAVWTSEPSLNLTVLLKRLLGKWKDSTTFKNYFDYLINAIETELGIYRLSRSHEILLNGMLHTRAVLNILGSLYNIPSAKLVQIEEYINYVNLAVLPNN